MLLKSTILLFTIVVLASADGDDKTFSDLCSNGYGYDVEVSDDDTYTVQINTDLWPSHKDSCTVVFMAEDSLDNLYFKFHDYDQSDTGITVTFESKYEYYYSREARYTYYSTPSIGSSRLTNTYLRVTVSRSSPYVATLRANFDVYTNDYDSSYLTVGSIVGIVFGVIAAVVGIIVGIVYYVIYSSTRRRSGGVVMATGVANPNGPTLTMTNAQVYPFVAPPQQHTVHPAYPAYPAYPGQTASPPSYPGPTAACPPAYPGTATATAEQPGKVKY